ncbi:S1 RNA-binding domain-containing protein [bacterium]|nr:S1 RNA-binding domain-containing protein [bacterium]
MMGITETDLMGGEPMPKRKRGQEPLPQMKLGKVFRIHDQDVFIDLPGGIKQGVLSILQFPEGNPVIGQEVEVKIEGFDGANGVMLLSRKGSAVSNANWSTVAVGMTVEARVTGVNKGGLEVDVHGIRGFMPISQIEMFRINELEPYLNQKLVCMVAEVDVASQNLVLSRRDILEKEKAEAKEKLWLELKEGQVREGIVRSVMPFGAFVDLGGVDGLLHISEMSWTKRINHPNEMVSIGDQIEVQVLNINKDKQEISLGMKQVQNNPWDKVAERYPPGTIVSGAVRNLTNYGAFIEIEEGIDGLLHVTDMSWVRKVTHPSEVVNKGDAVTCVVLNVDQERKRIALGLKQMNNDPWEGDIPGRYKAGELRKGKVTKLTNFGVFVELEPGLEGLLHISELSDDKIESPEEIVKVGDDIEVRVLRVDAADRKIGLSRRKLNEPYVEETEETSDDDSNRPQRELRGGTGSAGAGNLINMPESESEQQ